MDEDAFDQQMAEFKKDLNMSSSPPKDIPEEKKKDETKTGSKKKRKNRWGEAPAGAENEPKPDLKPPQVINPLKDLNAVPSTEPLNWDSLIDKKPKGWSIGFVSGGQDLDGTPLEGSSADSEKGNFNWGSFGNDSGNKINSTDYPFSGKRMRQQNAELASKRFRNKADEFGAGKRPFPDMDAKGPKNTVPEVYDPHEIAALEKRRIGGMKNGRDIKVIVDEESANAIKYICEPCCQHTYSQMFVEGHLNDPEHVKNIFKKSGKGNKGTELCPPGEDSTLMQPFNLEKFFSTNINDAIIENPMDSSLSVDFKKVKIDNDKELLNVLVGNLNGDIKASYLKYLFGRCGSVVSVRLLQQNTSAFVNFDNPQSCCDAIQQMNCFDICGCMIWVDFPDKGEDEPSPEEVTAQNLIPVKINHLAPHVPRHVLKMLFSRYAELKGIKQSKFARNACLYFENLMVACRATICMAGVKIHDSMIDIKFKFGSHYKESCEIGCKLLVRGIPYSMTNDSIRKIFINYGLIQINRNMPRKLAHLGFDSEVNARRAMDDLKGLEVEGSVLHICIANNQGKFVDDMGDWEPKGKRNNRGGDDRGNWGGNANNKDDDGWGNLGWEDEQPQWNENQDQSNGFWENHQFRPDWNNSGPGKGNQNGPPDNQPPIEQDDPSQNPEFLGPLEFDLAEGPIGNMVLELSKAKVTNNTDSSLALAIIDNLTSSLKAFKTATGDVDVVTFLGVAEKKIAEIKENSSFVLPKMKPKKPRRRMEEFRGNSQEPSGFNIILPKSDRRQSKNFRFPEDNFNNRHNHHHHNNNNNNNNNNSNNNRRWQGKGGRNRRDEGGFGRDNSNKSRRRNNNDDPGEQIWADY